MQSAQLKLRLLWSTNYYFKSPTNIQNE